MIQFIYQKLMENSQLMCRLDHTMTAEVKGSTPQRRKPTTDLILSQFYASPNP